MSCTYIHMCKKNDSKVVSVEIICTFFVVIDLVWNFFVKILSIKWQYRFIFFSFSISISISQFWLESLVCIQSLDLHPFPHWTNRWNWIHCALRHAYRHWWWQLSCTKEKRNYKVVNAPYMITWKQEIVKL